MIVRTRVAPSPTGDPHVGTAYVALMNYCFARKAGGEFILRIEDTDQQRSTAESERAILESLRWLGVKWSEGPDVGGPHGPYRQSERTAVYREYAQILLDRGHAFRCYCTPDRLEAMREEQRRANRPPAYDGHCLHLTPAQTADLEAAHAPYVVRMKIPATGVCIVNDLLRGPIEFEWHTVDMQVLMKSDGMPTYHLANVVDDHLMRITHVFRGEEWVPSAPKHVLLYQYFGWQMPQIGHLPLLRNADRSKLSKRKNPTSILFYRRMGYLPEALCNFLGHFAVSSAEGEEMMDMETLIRRFDIADIALGGPVFDVAKLDWFNARYIRETLDVHGFMHSVRDWTYDSQAQAKIAALAQPRIERLSDLGPLLSFFFAGGLQVTAEDLRGGRVDDATMRRLFVMALVEFDSLADWEMHGIERVMRAIGERTNLKFRDLVRPFYVAITGSPTSVPLFNSMELLGRDLCRERLRRALAALGGATKNEVQAWVQKTAGLP
jgi:glutamyl-tRNA synthetase